MELRPTLHAISDDTRGWLKAWAGDFTEAEAIEPVGDSLAPHPLVWQLGHLACTEEAASPAEFDRPPRMPNPYFRSLGQGVYEAALHENYHVGQIGALRKRLAKPRVG